VKLSVGISSGTALGLFSKQNPKYLGARKDILSILLESCDALLLAKAGRNWSTGVSCLLNKAGICLFTRVSNVEPVGSFVIPSRILSDP